MKNLYVGVTHKSKDRGMPIFNTNDIVQKKFDFMGNYHYYSVVSIIRSFNDIKCKYEYTYQYLNLDTQEMGYCHEQNLESAPEYNESLKYNL